MKILLITLVLLSSFSSVLAEKLPSANIKHPIITQVRQLNLPEMGVQISKNKADIYNVISMSLDDLKKSVVVEAKKIRFVNQCARKYEDLANYLAFLAIKEQNDKLAEKALWIMYLIAENTQNIYEVQLSFFNPGLVITPSVYAYDLLYNSNS